MKPELKKEWLEALRSGDYEQGREWLCRITSEGQERFCCLGVLVDVGLDADWTRSDRIGTPHFEIHKHRSGVLTHSDKEKLGLTGGEQGRLIGMNDDGKSFAEIADWIEENVR